MIDISNFEIELIVCLDILMPKWSAMLCVSFSEPSQGLPKVLFRTLVMTALVFFRRGGQKDEAVMIPSRIAMLY
jgi:hypothetical protein